MDLLICYSLPWLPGDEPGDPGRTMIKTDILVSFNFSFLEDAQGARRDTSSPGGQGCPPSSITGTLDLDRGLRSYDGKVRENAGEELQPKAGERYSAE